MIIRLPIHEGINKATDEVGLVTHGADMINVYVDDLLGINRWPGYSEFADTGEAAAVDGGYWWNSQSRSIVVCNGKTFQITDSLGTIAEISGDTFQTATRVKFADFGANLFGANGANINQITTSAVTQIADGDAPTTVSHVAILDRYLIGNETGSGNFHWADVNTPLTWTANYAEMESNPDNLVALDVQNLNIHGLGKATLEKWYDDGSTPFVRLYQGLIQSGTVAPYSFTWCQAVNSFCWLDEYRRVVMLSGGSHVPISISLNKYIHEFTTVSDAIGDYVELVGRPYYVLTFPSETKTIVYDFISKNWYRLGSWNEGTATYDRYRANCYWFAPEWNLTLIGDRANGKIYSLSPTTYDEDGSILRSLVRTAHYNHGTERLKKFCNGIYVRLKRTQTVSEDGTPDLMVRYRDDGNTSWNDAFTLTMHSSSNTEFVAYATALGSYESRQWEFYMTDSYPLVLVSVEEDVDFEEA
jgi:hypothetical protein